MLLAHPWGESNKGDCYIILYQMTVNVTINKVTLLHGHTHIWAIPDWSKTMLLCILCVSVRFI